MTESGDIKEGPDDSAASKPSAEKQKSGPPSGRARRNPAPARSFPKRTLKDALRVPKALKDANGGNPWSPEDVGRALEMGQSGTFYYLTAASRDYGLTKGTRDSSTIELTDLGKRAVYPESSEDESAALLEAMFKVDVFERVVKHYGGSKLPEKRFLANTLTTTFGIDESLHEEFLRVFNSNCEFLGIGADFLKDGDKLNPRNVKPSRRSSLETASSGKSEVVATPVEAGRRDDAPVCFVIMPFTEKHDNHAIGFFEEVLASLFTPAITAAGFTVKTAKLQGSDVIQATIVTELLDADLVVADLTEHNPNVLFELGMRMARDMPVALVRAKGTGAIFDVDNMLRVEEYNPNLWSSTVEKDVPRLTAHVLATWENRATEQTFMKILGRSGGR